MFQSIKMKKKNIIAHINTFFSERALVPCPPIIVVSILGDTYTRDLDPFLTIDVPFYFTHNLNGIDIEYELYSIIAYRPEHYMIYNKETEETWTGIDDQTSFIINKELITSLSGHNNDSANSIMKKNLGTFWVGRLFFYRKKQK